MLEILISSLGIILGSFTVKKLLGSLAIFETCVRLGISCLGDDQDAMYAYPDNQGSPIPIQLKNNSDIKLIRHLREQIDLELLIIKKVNEMNREHGPGTFARLFSDLARGEAIIKTLDRVGRIHFERMSKGYPSEGSIIEKWMNIVTEAIEGWVEEAVADGTLLDNKFRDHGFVNSPLFDELVRDTIQSLRPGKRVPERMVQIFLEDYRQGFNERIH